MNFRDRLKRRMFRLHRKNNEVLGALLDDEGHPNANVLADLTKNMRLMQLNIKAFGYELARQLATQLPVRTGTSPIHIGLGSKASTQADIESEWCAHWAAQLKIPLLYHRKLWELAFILQALYEHGHIAEGARGLGFGCGREPIPSYLASQGVMVTLTDLALEDAVSKGWASTNQHLDTLEAAHMPHLIDRDLFFARATAEIADMNAIPATLRDYDFCWSTCAMEHLGSIKQGLDFVESSLATLRPGGLSVHTMEFNVEGDGPTIDNWATVLFQRRHLDQLAARLRADGHWVAELDYHYGDKPMDNFIDIPPWIHDVPDLQNRLDEPYHLKLGIDGFVSTCFGIIVRKRA